MNDIPLLLKCISRGHIPICEHLAFMRGDYAQIRTVNAVDHSGFTDCPEYRCKVIWSSMESSVTPFLESMVGKQNFSLEKVSQLLGINNLQKVMANNIILIFPLYSRKLEFQDNDKD